MPEGLIVKALSGFYYVQDGESVRQCRARGIFKKKGISPLVGDRASYTPIGGTEGVIEAIAPRRVQLVRPPIANVDQVLLIFSLAEPIFNPRLLDRMLVQTERVHLPTVIVLTKTDLVDMTDLEIKLAPYTKMEYPILYVSTVQHTGIQEVREQLKNRITVFSGQSGVGKSTLLNEVMPGLGLKMGEVSRKLGTGKHTTRHVELIPFDENAYVADTPGFSQLDFSDMEPSGLAHCFLEIQDTSQDCYYRRCLHETEERCAVRQAADDGRISRQRYDHYLEFLAELKDAKERRY